MASSGDRSQLAGNQSCYTLLSYDPGYGSLASEAPTINDFKKMLETGDDVSRTAAMKRLLSTMMAGDLMPDLLMHVIRFVMPTKDKHLKKLLLLYYEIVPKRTPSGTLKQEFILVCNALRNDLQHPNEYVRGSTLRFLCKLREADIIVPLIDPIRGCLEHRMSYVRKNAVLALHSIFKFDSTLVPDAPELIAKFIRTETDATTRKNAFYLLINCDQPLAIDYLRSIIEHVLTFDESFQLAVIELIRKYCHSNPSERAVFVKVIFALLESQSHTVKYESATTLMSITRAPAAVKAAASAYIDLVMKDSDNNVKLIVLNRVEELQRRHPHLLDDLVLDLLKILNSPDLEVRLRVLDLAITMVPLRHVTEAVVLLRKELSRTSSAPENDESSIIYRQALVKVIHSCAVRFPETVLSSSLQLLMDLIGESRGDTAIDVVNFVREAAERNVSIRDAVTQRLIAQLPEIRLSRVFQGVLWVLSEFAPVERLPELFEALERSLGPFPLEAPVEEAGNQEDNTDFEDNRSVSSGSASSAVSASTASGLGRGTSSSATGNSARNKVTGSSVVAGGYYCVALNVPAGVLCDTPLRSFLLYGDPYLASALGAAVTKICLRLRAALSDGPTHADLNEGLVDQFYTSAIRIIGALLKLGGDTLNMTAGLSASATEAGIQSGEGSHLYQHLILDADAYERLSGCARLLTEPNALAEQAFLSSRPAFSTFLAEQHRAQKSTASEQSDARADHPETRLSLRQLQSRKTVENAEDQYETDLNRAIGADDAAAQELVSNLSRVVQLTGHSDPLYAEAYVHVNQYDILLDILVVNQTSSTLQNVTIELATLGDLKLAERPASHVLAPHDFCNMTAHIKVSSTEAGVIFGNISYDSSSASEASRVVVLHEIRIDVMDYIQPIQIPESQFRRMWTEFEWENKIPVMTDITDLHDYLNQLVKSTNMKCLTPAAATAGECDFLAANLYARSIFGEDCLANVSLERTSAAAPLAAGLGSGSPVLGPIGGPATGGSAMKIVGHIRIRAKTQGIAISLGDKILMSQKSASAAGGNKPTRPPPGSAGRSKLGSPKLAALTSSAEGSASSGSPIVV